MNFKYKRDRVLWKFVHEELRRQVSELDAYSKATYGAGILITSTVRTFKEQREINRKALAINPDYRASFPSVHNFGNGVDVGRHNDKGLAWPTKHIQSLGRWFAKEFPYKHGNKSSCIFHTGTAPHLHLQLNMRIYGIGIDQNSEHGALQIKQAILGLDDPSLE